MSTHVHLEGERLFELARENAEIPADVSACPRCAAELTAWREVLTTCRSTLAAQGRVNEVSAHALAERVLARTTREDPSWRGDLSVLGRFVASRWRASFPLRVAAASLMAYLLVVPGLAWYVLRDAPQGLGRGEFFTQVTPAPPALSPDVVEPDYEIESPNVDASAELDAADADQLAIENAIRWARFHLRQGAPATATGLGGSSADPVVQILAQRGARVRAFLRGDVHPESSPPWTTAGRDVAPPLQRALWCELLLDRFVLEGSSPDLLQSITQRLAELGQDVPPAVRVLEASALARAESYGLVLDSGQSATVLERLTDLRGFAASLPAASPLQAGAPLHRAWIAALEAAAGDRLRADPLGQAWLAWGTEPE